MISGVERRFRYRHYLDPFDIEISRLSYFLGAWCLIKLQSANIVFVCFFKCNILDIEETEVKDTRRPCPL